jgi:Domain of unknown function (DUF5134)
MGSLLPEWLEIVWTAVFAAVGCSHLRHMLRAEGQRRAWHACHVLMAAGMAFMYLPAATVPASFWQLVFAAAGVITAFWALGGVGSVATTIWLLTALDLGVMLLMWSGTHVPGPLVLVVVAYLAVEAGLWLLDVYRRLDGSTALINWQMLTPGGESLTVEGSASAGLLGELDITASMVAMAAGMAYMLIAMMIM